MDFLDSLENSLKSLESQEERDPSTARRRDEERNQTAAIAPWAEQLRNSSYTKALFDKAAAAGHRLRSKVYMAWLGSTLRLEARGRWCELRPTSSGIVVEYQTVDGNMVNEPLSLDGDPQVLLSRWLDLDGSGVPSERQSG